MNSTPALFVLDTNICIFIINRKPAAVRERMDALAPHRLAVSAITAHELRYGLLRSGRLADNAARLQLFLSGVAVLPFDEPAAARAAQLRATLARAGTPIGPLDTLIAGHALSVEATLVTNNTREFARVPDLPLEDWTQDPP